MYNRSVVTTAHGDTQTDGASCLLSSDDDRSRARGVRFFLGESDNARRPPPCLDSAVSRGGLR